MARVLEILPPAASTFAYDVCLPLSCLSCLAPALFLPPLFYAHFDVHLRFQHVFTHKR